MKTFSVRVAGIVQGVFFRASTKKKADELGLVGFVRNERDGSVYIEVSGEPEALELFFNWCRSGPPHARVDECTLIETEQKNFRSFEIRRF